MTEQEVTTAALEHIDLPRKIARGFSNGREDLQEELESLGRVELMVSIRKYRPEAVPNGHLGAFIAQRLKWAYLNYLNREKKHFKLARLDSRVQHDRLKFKSDEDWKEMLSSREPGPEIIAIVKEGKYELGAEIIHEFRAKWKAKEAATKRDRQPGGQRSAS